MFTYSILNAHPLLADFVYNYTVCRSVAEKITVTIPLLANHETSLCFFLSDPPVLNETTDRACSPVSAGKVSLVGLSTHQKGSLSFDGKCSEFIIEFKPNGFNKMFGIPATDICNYIFRASEVIGNCVERLHEQLLNAADVGGMVSMADTFLLALLSTRKRAYINDGITQICNSMVTNPLSMNMSQCAREAHMSIRNFERRFLEQVGTSPKFFCRLVRFKRALTYKLNNVKTSWRR